MENCRNEPATGNLVSQRVLVDSIWGSYYHHYDALGSTRQMTNSAGGIVKSSASYTAWGEAIAALTSESVANYFRWVGMLNYFFDDEADTYYVRARHYDPGTGRWLAQDPIGYDAGGFNLFGYVGNNPLNRTDPNGRGLQLSGAGVGGLLLAFLAICCMKHVAEIAAATNKKVEQIQAGWPPGYGTLARDHLPTPCNTVLARAKRTKTQDRVCPPRLSGVQLTAPKTQTATTGHPTSRTTRLGTELLVTAKKVV